MIHLIKYLAKVSILVRVVVIITIVGALSLTVFGHSRKAFGAMTEAMFPLSVATSTNFDFNISPGPAIQLQAGSKNIPRFIADVNLSSNDITATIPAIRAVGVTIQNINYVVIHDPPASTVCIFATLDAECNATPGNFDLKVMDNVTGVMKSITGSVNVDLDSRPTIGIYNNVNVPVNQMGAVMPTVLPQDNGTFMVTASTSPNFIGTSMVNPMTGEIKFRGTQAGTYTVTVTVTDNCGLTNFAPTSTSFTIMVGPTAASVTIGGRVLTADGRGIRNARVVMTNQNGGTRTVKTNPFGFYRFTDVPVGETYVFSVSSKEYQFSPQVFTTFEDFDGLDFYSL